MLRILLLIIGFIVIVGFAAPRLLGIDQLGSMIWFATNSTPPTPQLVGPPGVARGVVMVKVEGVDPGRAEVVQAQVDGAELAADLSWNLDTRTMPDGEHRIEVLVHDRSLRKNSASAEMVLRTDNTIPDMQVELRPAAPTEGRVLVLRVRTLEPVTVSGELNGRPLAIEPGSEFSWAVTGFPPEPTETTIAISLVATDEAGNTGTWDQTFDIVRTKYPLEHVDLPEEYEARLDPDVRAQEDAMLKEYYQQVNGPPRWHGVFAQPAPGIVTTIFGIARTYNQHDYVVHHGGVDFAAAEGDEVQASNDGVVVFAGLLELRGNTVIVDHGAGVYSTYAHMSEILTTTGAEVRKGEAVGLVGGTGLSTGPHMHWEIWAGGANVDPMEWTQREMP